MDVSIKHLSLFFFFLITGALNLPASATFIDINGLYMSDTFAANATTTSSRTSYDLGIGLEFGKGDRWIGGLNYGGGTFTDEGTTTVTFGFTDLGIKIGYFFSSRKTWFSTLAYNISSSAKYDNGTTEVELRGTSLKADLGYAVWVSDSIAVAMKLCYYAPTFVESVDGTTITDISYTRTLIYPSLSLMGLF